MNINENLFYAGMVTQEQKESLYTEDNNLASLVMGIHRVSGKELRVGSVFINKGKRLDDYGKEVTALFKAEIYMLNAYGFPVIVIGKDAAEEYSIANYLVDYKVRGKDKKTIRSNKPDRLIRLVKSKLLLASMNRVNEYYLSSLPRFARSAYRSAMKYDANYAGTLSGKEQFELLKVLLAGKSTADISDTMRSSWTNSYNKYIAQETKTNESRAELSEVFDKEVWAIYNSPLGFMVGTIRYDRSKKTFTQVMPHRLYSDISDIPDENVRDELTVTLTMCRTNRDQDPTFNTPYDAHDKNRFIPKTDHAFLNTQSSSWIQGGTGIFTPNLFMVPR